MSDEPVEPPGGRGCRVAVARQGKVAVWSRPDGVAMRFKKFANGVFGSGGLLKASWELTYTPVGPDFAL